jgi:hypothetical protein
VYEITVLEPHTGVLEVRGGKYFRERERVVLAGCSHGGAFLKVGAIHPGFRMEFLRGEQTVVTSAVRTIELQRGSVQ